MTLDQGHLTIEWNNADTDTKEGNFVAISNETNVKLLRSETLQKSLVNAVLEVNQKVDMKYFEGYSKLKLIQVNKYEPFENITAIICNRNRGNCEFTLGINDRKCPAECQCRFYWGNMTLHIDCSKRGLTYVPPLPVPITGGDAALNLRGNDIRELPINSLSGYNEITSLIVSNNRLTSLGIDRLPSKLNILDIRYNSIQTLGKDVIEYLSNLADFLQCGNQWIVHCDDHNLMQFLHKIYLRSLKGNLAWWADTINLHHLNAPCPDGCDCCFNRSTDHFMIDCRHAGINYYPQLAHSIPYNAILQLDGNKISSIEDSLGHASLKKLHLFENRITYLPFHLIPKNITHLDLRKNMLEALDDKVVDLLRDREVQLSGNPWSCDCRAKAFLSFLRQREPLEYSAALDRCNIYSGTCPEDCICCLDNSTSPSLIVDCRLKGLTEIPELPIPISGQSTLHFEGNYLGALPSHSLPGYARIGHLYLANNRLTEIDQLPENITTLDIRNNSISLLSHRMRVFFDVRIAASTQLKLFLSGNPWTCTCEDKDFLDFVKTRSLHMENLSDIYCGGTGQLLILTDESHLCPSGLVHYVTLTISFMLMVLTINLIFYFKQPILIWLYEHRVCLSLADERECDKLKRFDAFLSFTHKDEELIEEFVERLENGGHCFRLCFYLRDWLVGESIPECISQSVKDSKRIIILMTNNFLQSTWGRLEFRLALHATSQDRCKRLIVVLYPEVENFDDLDSELRTYMCDESLKQKQ
ncbi:protein toll-like [Drosophila obscura]|uniref:protein toll-like n=1 Tax=Drosophila obscura TaxID=7282 RepID=UPI001BB15719|nr:protein toll-like [Drosophila obscura]